MAVAASARRARETRQAKRQPSIGALFLPLLFACTALNLSAFEEQVVAKQVVVDGSVSETSKVLAAMRLENEREHTRMADHKLVLIRREAGQDHKVKAHHKGSWHTDTFECSGFCRLVTAPHTHIGTVAGGRTRGGGRGLPPGDPRTHAGRNRAARCLGVQKDVVWCACGSQWRGPV